MPTNYQQEIQNGMMTTENSRTFSTNDAVAGGRSSSNSSTQFEDDIELDFLLDTTPVYAPNSRPDTGGGVHVPNSGPENFSPSSSRSYDLISGVTDMIPDAGISQNLDPSEGRRTEPSIPTDQLLDTGSGDRRRDYHTYSDRSIKTLASHSEGIDQGISTTQVDSRRPWTPLFLHTNAILAFMVAYVLLLVALIVLWIIDDKNQGLATVDSNIRYIWKYGPTAVLATLAGFWGQVEHRTKQLMPWAILHTGPTSAASTLLLNYIEPAQPVSLYRSAKNGHYLVTLAMVGSLLIQLLTVISTGLLMLQIERIHHRGVAIETTEAFNEAFRLNSDITDQSIGDFPVLSAIALNNGNLSYPLGTSDRFAFSTLHVNEPIPGAKNMTIETTIDAFHAELGCEIVTDFRWNDARVGSDGEATAVITFATPSCHVETLTMGTLYASRTKRFFGYSNTIKCDNSSSSQRFVILLAIFQTDPKFTFDNTSILLCQPSYAIEPWSLTVNGTGTLVNEGSKSLSGSSNSPSLPLSEWDFMNAFLESLSWTSGTTTGPASSVGGVDINNQLDGFFNALVAFSMPPNIADFLDANYLLNETTGFFSITSAQLARSYLMIPSSQVISGTVSTDEQRLRIRGLSLYLMVVILGFLIVDAVLLYFTCPRNTVSRDPGSVGGLAVMMTESPSFCDVMSGKSLWSTSQLHTYLSKYQALSVLQPSDRSSEFRVVLARHGFTTNISKKDDDQHGVSWWKPISMLLWFTTNKSKKDDDQHGVRWWKPISMLLWFTTNKSKKEDDQHGVRWWQPISMRLWFKAAIIMFLLGLIGALESSYQISKQHDGLATVETESYVRFTWAYVPAFAMMAAKLLVGMIGDSSRILFPYHELRRKLNCTTENLFEDPLSKVTVHVVYSAIRQKQYALLATGLTMLLTPFLTIVSSGLFSPEPTTRAYDSIFRIDKVLNTSIDLEAAMTTEGEGYLGYQSRFNLNLILTNNLSYPEWTYGELAFHEMTIDTIKNTDKALNALYPDPTDLTIHATVPAVRATLDCTYVAPENVYISYTEYDYKEADIGITIDAAAQLSLPEECRNQTVYPPSNTYLNTSQPFAWFGGDQGLYYGVCGHMFAAFGSSPRNGSVQVMVCVPVVEQVQTDTTFSLPSYRIVAATTDEITAVPIANMTAAFFLNMWVPYGPLSGDTSATDGGNYDPTFRILLGAPGIATLETADLDAANAAYPKIAAALQHLFGLSYVQGLNLNARSNVPANASTVASGNISMSTMLEGQIVDPRAQMRLKQSVVSTRILEGLLGAIVICLLVSFWLLDTRKVMPENACSIAVAASLLAGADMLREVPSGAEWWGDGEAVKSEVFGKDTVFGLGWWGAEKHGGDMSDPEGNSRVLAERDGTVKVRRMRRRFGIDRGRAIWD